MKDIAQKSNYLGVTADARIFPFGRHRFTVYFKGGLEFDFLLKTKAEASFVNKEMKQHNDEVMKRIAAPADVTVLLHTATGVEFGKNSRLPIRLEAGPSVFLTQNASDFMKTSAAFNLLVSVHIPF